MTVSGIKTLCDRLSELAERNIANRGYIYADEQCILCLGKASPVDADYEDEILRISRELKLMMEQQQEVQP